MFAISGKFEKQELKDRLLQIIKEKSYREGDFTLASGRKSNFYLDLKETTLNQEGIAIASMLMVDLILDKNLKAHGVGGLTMGADPLATGVSLAATLRGLNLQAFLVRKQAKDHGTLAWIEGAKTFPKGADLIVLEDVVTSGGSSLQAVEKLQAAGFKVSAILAVMDREEGARVTIEAKGIRLFSLCSLTELRSQNKN